MPERRIAIDAAAETSFPQEVPGSVAHWMRRATVIDSF